MSIKTSASTSFYRSVRALVTRDWRMTAVVAIGVAGIVLGIWAGVSIVINKSADLTEKIEAEGVFLGKIYGSLYKEAVETGIYSNTFTKAIQCNESVPVVVVENKDGSIESCRNIFEGDSLVGRGDTLAQAKAQAKLDEMLKTRECDSISLIGLDVDQTLYVGESNIVNEVATVHYIEGFFFVLFVLFVLIFVIVFFFLLRRHYREQREADYHGFNKEFGHQLGQPLQSLRAIHYLVKNKIPLTGEDIDKFNDNILRLTEISDMIQEMGDDLSLKNAPLNTVLEKVRKTVDQTSSARIKVAFTAPDGVVYAPYSQNYLYQAVYNICKNAVDAIGPNEGSVIITLNDVGDKAVIQITDTGGGMTDSVKDHIFDSGFSTKKKEKKVRGFGLAFVQRIIEKGHGGKVFVAWTEVGVGTTFKIVLNKEKDTE